MQKKRTGLLRILFGRSTIFVGLIVVQIVILIVGFDFFDSKVLVANNILGILAVIFLIYILNARQNSSFKLMWIILIIGTPIFGVPFYIFTRIQPGTKRIADHLENQLIEQKNYLLPEDSTVDRLTADVGSDYGIFKYLYEEGKYPVYDNCGLKYFPQGEDKFEELLKQLRAAERFIFLEYFIIDKGYMWGEVLEILKEKVKEGVEVRLIYDGTNSMLRLPRNYPEEMARLGIKCRVFSPMVPFLSTHQNNRDHRKIVVIDGHTAFTGGINLADEYINRVERFGHWKDTSIMVKGRAVDSFTLMFLQMWNVRWPSVYEDYDKYMFRGTIPDSESVTFGGYVAPYGDSPLDNEEVGKKVYLDILNRATEYVHIMTPYLILDEELTNALIFAAQRGIDVKIITPHIPDKKYAYFLARSHYEELVSNGVNIYEYTPGFVHAKVFTSDNNKAVVGSINLDFRSLYLHFECATYIYRSPAVSAIESDFEETLNMCQLISLKDCKKYSIVGKICGKALRLIAPLM